jgi:hypothetical protein
VKNETDEHPSIPLWLIMGFGGVVLIGLIVSLVWYFYHHGTFKPIPGMLLFTGLHISAAISALRVP